MKMKDLVNNIKSEVVAEEREVAGEIIREKVIEVRGMRVILKQAEAQLEELLNKEVSDVVWSE